MVGGDLLGAYCLSEPHSGSDAAALATRAERDGDGYVVNGTKAWITHGGRADFYSMMVRTSDDGARGISCLLVDGAHAGLTVAPPERKMGTNASPTAQMIFDDVRVPADRLHRRRGRRLQRRPGGASTPAGWASPPAPSAWPRPPSTRPSPTRRSGGSSGARSASSRAWRSCSPTWPPRCRRARPVPGRGPAQGCRAAVRARTAAMAKLAATDTAMKVTTDAIQVLGGAGYTPGLPGRALLPRGQGAADRRGHEPGPADGDRPGAAGGAAAAAAREPA